ncbi:MAG: ATPase, partial [Jannaschia sp.]
DWLADSHGARLAVTQGVVPVAQPPEAMIILRAKVGAFSPWELTALSELVSLSGSLVLALAVMEGHLSPEATWTLSRVDEDWQIAQWGEDADEAVLVASKRAAFLHAAAYLALLRAR